MRFFSRPAGLFQAAPGLFRALAASVLPALPTSILPAPRLLPALGQLLVLLCSLLPCVTAYAAPAAPLPAFVRPLPVPLTAAPPPERADAGTYLLLIDEQQDLATQTEYRHYASRVLSEAGLEDASQIAIDRDPAYQALLLHRITRWRGGAATELLPGLKPTDMRREEGWEWGILDGEVTRLFSLEDVRVGDVIEHAYTLRGANPIFGGAIADERYLRFAMPVERIGLRLLHPPSRRVTLSRSNGAPDPAIREAGGSTEWTWDLAKVPGLPEEAEAPSWHDPYPRVQWSEYGSWAEVVAWALPLYPLDAPLSPELEAVAASLRKLPERERIRGALRLVQDEVRYLGLEMGPSSHRPALPAAVYARRFGDCKDKSLLFCALLRRLGVRAVPVLVNTRDCRRVEGFLPSPFAFDHVIARVELDGGRYYLDPTRTRQRGDPLETQDLEYGRGLAVAPGTAGLDTLDPGPRGGGKVRIVHAFTVADFDSAARFEVRSEYTGGEADAMRAQLSEDGREEMGRDDLNFFARYYPRIRAEGIPRVEEDTAANRLTVLESYRVDSLCYRDGDGDGDWVCDVRPKEIAGWVSEPDRRYRASPYALAYPKWVEQVIEVELPGGAEVHPEGRKVETQDIAFRWNRTSSGNRATLQFSYEAKADHVPLDRYPAYLDALDDIQDNLDTEVRSVSGSETAFGTPSGPLTPVVPLVWASLLGLIPGFRYARRLRRLHETEPPLPGGPPPPIRGWLMLLGALVLMSPIGWAWYLSGWGYLFDPGRWARLTSPGSEDFHLLWAPFLMAAHAAAAALACSWGAVCGAFVRKQRVFIDAFAALTLADLCFSTFEYVGVSLLPDSTRPAEWRGAETVGLMLSALFSLALIRVVTRSRRVAETFVAPRIGEMKSGAGTGAGTKAGAEAGTGAVREKSSESAG